MKLFSAFLFFFIINTSISKADYKIIEYPNGDRYIGNVKNGVPHGKGSYTYANESWCQGTFKDGFFYKCVFTKSRTDYSSQTLRVYTPYGANKLWYEVPESWSNVVKCKLDDKQKKIFEQIKIISKRWTEVTDVNKSYFCVEQVLDRRKIQKIILISSIPVILGIFYLIILARRNNAINNYNLKHKTKFKKYLDYKKHIDKIKSKELNKDEKRRSKLEKTENLDDENLMGKVKRLKSLYNNGTLTKAEFEKAKNKLLK